MHTHTQDLWADANNINSFMLLKAGCKTAYSVDECLSKGYTPAVTSFKRFPDGSDGKESTCNAGDPSLIPRSERSPGEGNGNPCQYSFLEIPIWTKEPSRLQSMDSQESDMT